MPIIEIRNLVKRFSSGSFLFDKKTIGAVEDVNLTIDKKETLGLVGESGCGKSTLGLLVLRLLNPDSGEIIFDGKDIAKLSKSELRNERKRMQMIFQDPYSSLNPRMKVKDIVGEPLIVYGVGSKLQRQERIKELIDFVGLSNASLEKYPHEFSGGQRQRIGIARSIALKPEFIVADEAVSALDVSIRGGILNLLSDLKSKMDLSFLFISHDLNVVEYMSDRIAVMYLGRIVELLPKADFSLAKHPYTQALYASMPTVFSNNPKISIPKGDIPSLTLKVNGCAFHPRCKYAMDMCKIERPQLKSYDKNHLISCFLLDK